MQKIIEVLAYTRTEEKCPKKLYDIKCYDCPAFFRKKGDDERDCDEKIPILNVVVRRFEEYDCDNCNGSGEVIEKSLHGEDIFGHPIGCKVCESVGKRKQTFKIGEIRDFSLNTLQCKDYKIIKAEVLDESIEFEIKKDHYPKSTESLPFFLFAKNMRSLKPDKYLYLRLRE